MYQILTIKPKLSAVRLIPTRGNIKSSIIAFQNPQSADCFRKLIEAYKQERGSWPTLCEDGFTLYSDPETYH